MFRRILNAGRIERSVLMLDPDIKTARTDVSAIRRNDLAERDTSVESELFERASRIYFRARRNGRRRAVGII